MIRIGAGIDDVSNGPGRDLFDRSHDRSRCRRRTRIDDHHTIVSDLNADVAAGAGDHEKVGAELEYLEIAAIGRPGFLVLSGAESATRLGDVHAGGDSEAAGRREGNGTPDNRCHRAQSYQTAATFPATTSARRVRVPTRIRSPRSTAASARSPRSRS